MTSPQARQVPNGPHWRPCQRRRGSLVPAAQAGCQSRWNLRSRDVRRVTLAALPVRRRRPGPLPGPRLRPRVWARRASGQCSRGRPGRRPLADSDGDIDALAPKQRHGGKCRGWPGHPAPALRAPAGQVAAPAGRPLATRHETRRGRRDNTISVGSPRYQVQQDY